MPIALVAATCLADGWRIVAYMSKPSYSFHHMAQAVGKIIQEREGTVHGVLLFGDIANSVSLETGTNAVNGLYGSDMVGRIRECHPQYVIVLTSNVLEIVASEGGEATKLGAWDVFGNYYANGEQVRLYSVRSPGENALPARLHGELPRRCPPTSCFVATTPAIAWRSRSRSQLRPLSFPPRTCVRASTFSRSALAPSTRTSSSRRGTS